MSLFVPSLALLACGQHEKSTLVGPTLDEVSPKADAVLDLVDRDIVLADAIEGESGPGIDFGSLPAGFAMTIDSQHHQQALSTDSDGGANGVVPTYWNVLAGLTALTAADIATALVVGTPAAAMTIAISGDVVQVAPYSWTATNSVIGLDGVVVTGKLNVNWVEAGWLAEMRLSTADGRLNNDLWFNGFLDYSGAVGWWDYYDAAGNLTGVIEWDGIYGDGEFAIANLAGPGTGDRLTYSGDGTGFGRVALHDASIDYLHFTEIHPDNSGVVQVSTYNFGEAACWDVLLVDTPCH